jgi:hypothetical protein
LISPGIQAQLISTRRGIYQFKLPEQEHRADDMRQRCTRARCVQPASANTADSRREHGRAAFMLPDATWNILPPAPDRPPHQRLGGFFTNCWIIA